MTTYYVPQPMTGPSDTNHNQAANTMVPLQYQPVGPTAFSQTANNNTISSYQCSNKRSTPPNQHQHHFNAQQQQHQTLQMSSNAPHPYASHYNPVTAATMIFAPPNIYPGMVAAYHSSVQTGSTPIITSPSSSVSSTSNAAITASSPPALCEPSSPASSYTTVVHTTHSPSDGNKLSNGESPTEALSPPITIRKPLFQNNRFASQGTNARPKHAENGSALNYSNNNTNNNPSAYQPHKFKQTSFQNKRPSGEQPAQPYSANNNFHQSFQPNPLMAAGVPASFRHVSTAVNDKFRANGPRSRPPNLDLRRSISMTSSSIQSPSATNDISGEQQSVATTPTTVHHIPHTVTNNYRMANSFVEGTAGALHHQQQQAASYYGAAGPAGSIGPAAYSGAGGGSPGMYVKLGGAFFAHHVGPSDDNVCTACNNLFPFLPAFHFVCQSPCEIIFQGHSPTVWQWQPLQSQCPPTTTSFAASSTTAAFGHVTINEHDADW